MIYNKEDYYKNIEIECLEGEVWKDVIGYEGFYKISNYGRLKSIDHECNCRNNSKALKKGKIRRLRYSLKTEYATVDLYKNQGKRKYFRVHRLVVEAFHGKIPKGYIVKHLNNNKQMNCEWNLKIDTSKNNALDARKDGLYSNKRVNYNWKVLNLDNEIVLKADSSSKLAEKLGYSSGRQVRDNCDKNRPIGLDNKYNGFIIIKELKNIYLKSQNEESNKGE